MTIRTIFRITVTLSLITFLTALFLPTAGAGKGGKGGGGGGNSGGGQPTQTIYYQEDGVVYAVDELGGNMTLIGGDLLINAVPSALVYGTDPVLDRWWLTVDGEDVNSEGQFITENDLYAVHPGRGLFIQLTDFVADSRKISKLHSRAHVRLSNDGQDSFISFMSAGSDGNDGRLHRINVSLSVLEVMLDDPSWTPIRFGDAVVETVWQNGPSQAGWTILAHDYDWSPEGTQIAMYARETTGEFNSPGWYTAIKRFDIATEQLSTIFTLQSGSYDLVRWAPSTSPIPNTVAYNFRGLELVAADGQADPQILKENTNRQRYAAPRWSPNGDAFVNIRNDRVGSWFDSNWDNSLEITTLDGQTTTLVPSSPTYKAPLDWRSNLPAAGY